MKKNYKEEELLKIDDDHINSVLKSAARNAGDSHEDLKEKHKMLVDLVAKLEAKSKLNQEQSAAAADNQKKLNALLASHAKALAESQKREDAKALKEKQAFEKKLKARMGEIEKVERAKMEEQQKCERERLEAENAKKKKLAEEKARCEAEKAAQKAKEEAAKKQAEELQKSIKAAEQQLECSKKSLDALKQRQQASDGKKPTKSDSQSCDQKAQTSGVVYYQPASCSLSSCSGCNAFAKPSCGALQSPPASCCDTAKCSDTSALLKKLLQQVSDGISKSELDLAKELKDTISKSSNGKKVNDSEIAKLVIEAKEGKE